MMKSIPYASQVQSTEHDPLRTAVLYGDEEFAEFLLKYGALPDFRGIDGMNMEDCLWQLYQKNRNPHQIEEFINLFKKYSNWDKEAESYWWFTQH